MPPVNANKFLDLFQKYLPQSTLSIGWTTAYENGSKYTQSQSNSALNSIRGYGKLFSGQRITYPVRAAYVYVSLEVLKNLVHETGDQATITIWTALNDRVDPIEVASFINAIGIDKCYLDVPEEMEFEIRKYFLSH